MNRSVVMAFLMVLSVAALSRERRTCTVEAITNNCTEIGEDSDAQDPWFPERPMVSDSASEIIILGGGDSDKEKVLQVQKVNLDAQANIVRKLRTGSPHFLLAISSPLNLASISELSKKRKGASSSFVLPWPPDKADAELKKVSWQEVESEYLSKLSAEDRALLMEQADRVREAQESLHAQEPGLTISSASQETPKPSKLSKSEAEAEKERQIKRMKALFEKARTYLIEELKARPLVGTQESREDLIRKLETVSFGGVKSTSTNCSQDNLNAYYSRTEHEVVICSAYSKESDLALMGVLGHELGHAIDPCGCRYSHHHTASSSADDIRAKIDQLRTKKKITESEAKMAEEKFGTPRKLVGGANLSLYPEALSNLEKAGVITTSSPGVKGTYPLDTTYRCLRDSHKFAEGKETSTDKRIERLKKQGVKLFPSSTERDLAACRNSGQSEMNEAMADVFRGKVLGRYALETGAGSLEDMRSAFASFIRPVCKRSPLQVEGVHPFSRERIEKIVLSEPLIQEAFNCKPTPSTHCHKFFGHLPGQIPRAATGTKGSKQTERGVR